MTEPSLAGPPVVTFLAFVPEVESRGSIPVALLGYNMDVASALGWTLLGNLAGIPVAWWLLPWAARQARRVPALARILDWLLAHTRRRASRSIERWQELGILLFVGIPLPGTGAWAGVAAAHLFGLSGRRAAAPLVLGTVMAAVIVTVLVKTGQLAL